MSLRHVVILMILLISATGLAGCTGSPPQPVVTPTPSPLVSPGISTPAPAGIVAPAAPSAAWTPETLAAGHPYSKTYSFHGSGDYEDFTFTTDNDAMWVFRMDPGDGYFLVSLKDTTGKEIEVLPNTGTKSLWLKAGNYHFDIAADSPWYITMSTP